MEHGLSSYVNRRCRCKVCLTAVNIYTREKRRVLTKNKILCTHKDENGVSLFGIHGMVDNKVRVICTRCRTTKYEGDEWL
jgi:hypothetical protein